MSTHGCDILKKTILKRAKRFPSDDLEGEAEKEFLFQLGKTTPFSRVDAGFTPVVPNFIRTEVYIDEGVPLDAILYDVHFLTSRETFYRIQLLVGQDGHFMTFIREGTVDTNGTITTQEHANLQAAKDFFHKAFFDTSGLTWENRLDPPRNNKMDFLDGDYQGDSPTYKSEEEARLEFDARYPPPLQALLSCMFDRPYFEKLLRQEIGYETRVRALKYIRSRSAEWGFDILANIAEHITTPASQRKRYLCSYDEALNRLTTRYHAIIPPTCGPRPNIISTMEDVKYEIEVILTLHDMVTTEEIMLGLKEYAGERFALQTLLNRLPMKEIVTLDPSSTEFKELEIYLQNSSGITHDFEYRLLGIFRIERNGEEKRFRQSKFANIPGSDRRLLWRGSRSPTYGGILKHGLCVPSETAPANAFSFGQGLYLSDCSSVAAADTRPKYAHRDHWSGLLLLCDAELGPEMLELDKSEPKARKICTWYQPPLYGRPSIYVEERTVQKISCHGKGRCIPAGWKDASCVNPALKGVTMPDGPQIVDDSVSGELRYNEWVIYNDEQIRLRYLFHLDMNSHGGDGGDVSESKTI
ncbi:unnamed protein product [Penicillium salamii]|nr:unnamed protein product [Penicillium salamii]